MTPELMAKLEACKTLPSPPGVAVQIISLANDPEADIQKISKVMALDPAITIKVLRLANSPLYARRGKVESLRQAVVVLGLNATMSLALSFSLVKSWQDPQAKDTLDYPLFWRRALLAATIGRVLAEQLGLRNAEEVFLTCLIQDIGMLALTRSVEGLYADLPEGQVDHQAVIRRERERVGSDHAAVGGWLLKRWSFPDSIEQGVAASHDPARIPQVHSNAVAARCVHVSSAFAEIFLRRGGEQPLQNVVGLAQRHLALSKDRLGQVVHSVRAALPEIEAAFDTPLNVGAQADAILEDAREALMLRNLQSLQAVDLLRDQAESLESRTRGLEESNRRDGLTGTFNRRHLDEFLAAAYSDAAATGRPLTVAFADLDRFKYVNDTYGHQVGDEVLITMARLLQCQVRSSDIVARYGGEEFVMVFPNTDRDTATLICERIIRACRRTSYPVEPASEALTVTISIGTATMDLQNRFSSVEALITAADEALYKAKQGGRNRQVPYDLVA